MMSSLLFLCCLVCLVLCAGATSSEKPLKRENVFGSEDSNISEIHNILKHDNPQTDDEIRAAFPVMDAFKSHQLFTPEDLKDKREYENTNEEGIELAVEAALKKLRKKKELYADAVRQNTAALNDETHEKFEDKHKKKNVTAKELIDEVVKDEVKSHGDSSDSSDNGSDDDNESEEDSQASSRSSFDDDQIHKKLAEIALLEKKLTHLVRQVKHYLRKKKAQSHKSKDLEDNDDVESILAEADDKKKKRSGIPHTSVIEKFRKNPELVDKYMDSILNDDSDTANGDQRDLLGKKDMETTLLRDAVPGEINSIPLSRLDKESDDYESMATDRGVARNAMVESPFSILDVKKTTGKKFRHDVA